MSKEIGHASFNLFVFHTQILNKIFYRSPEREDGARSDGDSEYNSPDRRRQMDEGSHVGNKKLDTLPIGYHFLKGETLSPSSAGGSPSSPRSGVDDAMSTGGAVAMVLVFEM